MTESEDDVYTSDQSLPNSLSLVFSDNDTDEYEHSSAVSHQKRSEEILLTPEEKLRRCERKLESCIEKGFEEQAFSQLLKLLPLRRLVFGDCHWKYAEACLRLAKGYYNFKKYEIQATSKAEKALQIILTCNSPASNEKILFTRCLVEIYLILGKSLNSAKRYKEADCALRKSWQVLKSLEKQTASVQIPTANSESTLTALKYDIKKSLADVYICMKEINKAVSALTYLVKEISNSTSDKDERLVMIYLQFVKAEKARKKADINNEIIIEYAIKAHDISTSCHSLHSVEVGNTAFALGQAYGNIDSEKTLNASETYLEEAFAIYKSCYGSFHKKTLQVQDVINKLWLRKGKEDDVIKSLQISMKKKSEVFGECSSQMSETHKLIAGIYLTKGDLSKAHKYLNHCFTIERELYGSQHRKTKETRTMMTQIEENPGFTKSSKATLAERPKFSSTIKSPKG